jgi:hypothetical protein
MMIKIQKKVELPKDKTRPYRYPWNSLEVGDSFFIPHKNSPYTMLRQYNSGLPKKKKIKITRRLEGDGQRVWRIK